MVSEDEGLGLYLCIAQLAHEGSSRKVLYCVFVCLCGILMCVCVSECGILMCVFVCVCVYVYICIYVYVYVLMTL